MLVLTYEGRRELRERIDQARRQRIAQEDETMCARGAKRLREVRRLADGDPRHGSHNGYYRFGCRCGRCEYAEEQYQLAWLS